MKTKIVKLEDFDLKIKRLKFKDVFDTVEALTDFDNISDDVAEHGFRKIIMEKREVIVELSKRIAIFPKNTTVEDLYPEDLYKCYDTFMEVNNGFLDLMAMMPAETPKVPTPAKNSASKKSTKD